MNAHDRPMTAGSNLLPLLHQIRYAMRQLLDGGGGTTIDLRGVPLTAAERERLFETLGQGEIRVRLEALGRSDIDETAFSGVWLITHYSESGEVVARLIEIARVPGLLAAPTGDIENGWEAMGAMLEAG